MTTKTETQIADLKALDRSVMSVQEKRKHTMAIKALEAELAEPEAETATSDAAEIVSDAEADAFAIEQTAIVVGAIQKALDAENSYTGTLIEVAIECESEECFTAIKDAAYAQINEMGLVISGSIRNAFSVIKWALVNGELADSKGNPNTINAIKKAKQSAKNVASSSEKSDEDSNALPETGCVDLDIAITNIAALNTKAGELRKALKAGDTLAERKAMFLRDAAALALDTYANMLKGIQEENDFPIIEDDLFDDEGMALEA